MLLSLLSTLLVVSSIAAPITLHIAPEGDDTRDGLTLATALKSPIAASARAYQLVAARPGNEPANILITFAPGRYELGETWVVTPPAARTAPVTITYNADRAGTVTLSGGTVISDWKKTTLRSASVWAASPLLS